MKPEERQAVINRYNRRLKIYGYDPRTLGWTKDKEAVRFQILSEIGNLDRCSILDVGCGFGDFYGFLVKKGLSIKYTGYDINPKLIEMAKRIYPGTHFEVKDLEEEEVNERFDWVFESGIFNFKLHDNRSFIESMLRRMFQFCSLGVAADFLSSYVDWQNKDAYHSSPEETFAFCKTLSKRAVLRHDYMPFEFCVYIYKNDVVNKRNVFAQFHNKLI